MEKSRFIQILEKVCAKKGATLIFHDEFFYAGCIEFSQGKRSYFRGTTFDINSQGACYIAKDKNYCTRFLRRAGFITPTEEIIFSPTYREYRNKRRPGIKAHLPSFSNAVAFVEKHGFPVFVKPNEGTEGKGVELVNSMDELFDVVHDLFIANEQVLIQRPIVGKEYRAVVLNGKIMALYERMPMSIFGDGVKSVETLITEKFDTLASQGRQNNIPYFDPRINSNLEKAGLSLSSVPPKNHQIQLLSNANLSSGGLAIDVTKEAADSVKKTCIDAANQLGLTFAGVDIFCQNATESHHPSTILEINSAPQFNNYTSLGAEQEASVEALYEELLETISRAL